MSKLLTIYHFVQRFNRRQNDKEFAEQEQKWWQPNFNYRCAYYEKLLISLLLT